MNDLKEVCELKWCVSNHQDEAVIMVNENIGEESYLVQICQACAWVLGGLRDGSDLPEAHIVERLLKNSKKHFSS